MSGEEAKRELQHWLDCNDGPDRIISEGGGTLADLGHPAKVTLDMLRALVRLLDEQEKALATLDWIKAERDSEQRDAELTRNKNYALEAKLSRLRRVEEAAQKFHAKVAEVSAHPQFKSVFQMAWVHGGKYKGPNWGEEEKALAAALDGKQEAGNG